MAKEQQQPLTITHGRTTIKLQRAATIDCSDLFETQVDESNGITRCKLKHNDERTLNLAPLATLAMDEDEFLFSEKIFVRDCMQEVFYDLVSRPQCLPKKRITIVIGSPGVGKSLLSFLAALQIAWMGEKKVLFLRKTRSIQEEPISLFWMTKSNTKNGVDVYFNRDVDKNIKLADLRMDIEIDLLEKNSNGKCGLSKLRTFVDGPDQIDEKDDWPSHSDIVTSGCEDLKNEQVRGTQILPMSAWTLPEMRQGMKVLHGVPEEIVNVIYDTIGGNYRETKEITDQIEEALIRKRQNLPSQDATVNIWSGIDTDNPIVKKVIDCQRNRLKSIIRNLGYDGIQNIHACIPSTTLQGGGIDELRSMHNKFTYWHIIKRLSFDLHQLIRSAYVMRELGAMVSLSSFRQALATAKQYHKDDVYGWHFECFGHKIFQTLCESLKEEEDERRNPNPWRSNVRRFDFQRGSISELNRVNLYWTSDTPNFPNVDAAIAIGNVLYCLQYTIDTEQHEFNYSTFVSKFWDPLDDNFKMEIQRIKVVFVLPEEPASYYNVNVGTTDDHKYFVKGDDIALRPDKPKTASSTTASSPEINCDALGDESEKPPAKKQKVETSGKRRIESQEEDGALGSRNKVEEEDEKESMESSNVPPIERIELAKECLSEKYELCDPPLSFMQKDGNEA